MSQRRLLRIGQVEDKVGLKRSPIYAEIKKGEFPPPIKIGSRSSAWVEDEIDAWIEARIALRQPRQRKAEAEAQADIPPAE
jgi:prophage regulatory protein